MMPFLAFLRAQWAQSVSRHGLRRIVLLLGCGLLLFWLTASHILMEGLSGYYPNAVLFFRPYYPSAVQTIAEEQLRSALERAAKEQGSAPGAKGAGASPASSQSSDLGRLREQLAGALANEPLNARTVRQLGQAAELQGDAKGAQRLMRMAARLSLTESVAVDWMMRKSFFGGDHRAAVYYADALLRSHSELVPYAAPALGQLAETKTGRDVLVKFLATEPPWRNTFLRLIASNVADARTPFEIFMALKDTPAPPQQSELRAYVEFLTGHEFFDLAYFTWLQFLPPEQLANMGFLFNGGFEQALSGFPFDWTIGRGTGVTVDIAPRLDAQDKRGLLVSFGAGRASFPRVYQWAALPPGDFRFKGLLKGELIARRGLQWSVHCHGGQTIGESEMFLGRRQEWTNFEFAFTVPTTGCAPEIVILTHASRSPSEQMASGAIWFDDLTIVRAPEN